MRAATGLPVICGVGVDGSERAAVVARAADVVMVGTCLLRAVLGDGADPAAALGRALAQLRAAVRAPAG